MRHKFFGKEISGPFTIPSGIITTEIPTLKRIAEDVPQVGILTTKSIGRYPRDGNREPIVHCVWHGAFANAVGLRNPGADVFAKKLSELELPRDKFLLASVFGARADEMVYVVERLEPYADGFELNYSCPHSPGHGASIGHHPDSVSEFTHAVRKKTDRPIIAKLSPNLEHGQIQAIARAAVDAGADGITAINTVGPDVYRINGHPILTNPAGGSLSGSGIKNRGIEVVKAIRKVTSPKTPIIGMGGIATAADIMEYKNAGADYFGIGTALAGMGTKQIAQYLAALENDLEHGTNEAQQYLVSMESGHRKFRVRANRRPADDLSVIELDDGFEIEPGQFVFAWIPGVGEKPYSLLYDDPAKIAVQKRGQFSAALANAEEGTELYLRGPCGNPLDLDGVKRAVLVGGGTGTAALFLIARQLVENGADVYGFVGAKDREHLIYLHSVAEGFYVSYATDDGSFFFTKYYKGTVAELLEKEIKKGNFLAQGTVFFNCGPDAMIRAAEAIERGYVPQEQILSSNEGLTMCGYGLCGACAREDGLRLCVDGPFMNPIEQNKY